MTSKTIHPRALLVALLSILGAGCALAAPATDPSGKTVRSVRPEPAPVQAPPVPETEPVLPHVNSDLLVELQGKTIVVTLSVRMQCRPSRSSSWSPCGSKPVAGKPLIGKLTGLPVSRSTTDADGRVTFDLSTVEPDDALIAKPQFEVATVPANAFDIAVNSIDLADTSLLDGWKRAHEENTSRQAHAEMRGLLDQLEQGLARVNPPWTDERLRAFGRLVQLAEAMTQIKKKTPGVLLPPEDEERARKVGARMSTLVAGYAKALEASQAKATKLALVTGRKVVLAKLRAPSTARFVSDDVLLQCPLGYVVTVHEVDAQNGFGAMVRGRFCPKFNATTERIVVSGSAVDIGNGAGFSIDTDCSSMWLSCNTLDGWKATVGF
jgi:hypothetical protein